jgi:hypothetical protein
MSLKTLTIKNIRRLPSFGVEDELTFELGVNVIVGQPNTGKSRWMRMIDYAFGDPGQPAETFGEDLAEKYEAVQLEIEIGNEEYLIERRWKEEGSKGKVFVNDEVMLAKDFQHFLLEQLDIPILRFPKGNPFEERTWPELSWRILFRHIYRQQRFWNELADKQPDSEQFACLVQFLGIAETIFSADYELLVAKRKELDKLKAQKDQFLSILAEISKELISEQEVGVTPTKESLNKAVVRLQDEVKQLRAERAIVLEGLLEDTVSQQNKISPSRERSANQVERWGDELNELILLRENTGALATKARERLNQVRSYKNTLVSESSKMNRTQSAVLVFADLKVTHCPVCDQTVKRTNEQTDQCYLCHQPWPNQATDENRKRGGQRINFELEQLQAETQEVDELIQAISKDLDDHRLELRQVEEKISIINSNLQSARQTAAYLISPRIAELDAQVGRVEERIRQLERINASLDIQDELSKTIDATTEEISRLQALVRESNKQIDFEQAGDVLAQGMNSYLNALTAINAELWTQQPIYVDLDERSFKITVGRKKWASQLGGTLTLYFLIAYHYALFELSSNEEFNYPGLLLLDFPATLEDGVTVTDKENYILKPFVDKVREKEMSKTQVIAAGNAFEGLEGANRIKLEQIWK